MAFEEHRSAADSCMPAKGTTFYKRVLPCPPAVSFSSPEGASWHRWMFSRLSMPAEPSAHAGKCLFAAALQAGTMQSFFKLIEQFRCATASCEPKVWGSRSSACNIHSTIHQMRAAHTSWQSLYPRLDHEAGLRMSQPIVDWQAWPWC